jgi:hypothetical protein
LLWRNETPLDDDSYNNGGEKDRQSHETTNGNVVQPGLIATMLQNSRPAAGDGVADAPVADVAHRDETVDENNERTFSGVFEVSRIQPRAMILQ